MRVTATGLTRGARTAVLPALVSALVSALVTSCEPRPRGARAPGGERARGSRADATVTTVLLPGDSARGATAYEHFGCASCHGSPGASRAATAPPLDHIGSRQSRYPFRWPTPELDLRASLRRPNAYVVDGFRPVMPSSDSLGIGEQELYDLVAYLRALR